MGAVMPVALSAPTNVVVCQWPCGMGATQRLPRGARAVAPRHLCRGSGLVDEHQPIDVDLRLKSLPGGALRGHVRAILLAGVRGFFEGDGAAIEEPPQHARHEPLAVRLEKMVGEA